MLFFFFSSRRRHTRFDCDWSSDVCSSDLSSLTLTAPNGGETWTAGSSQNITWTKTGSITNVKLEYSTDGGTTYPNLITSSTPAAAGSYAWTVPDLASTNVKVRVTNTADTTVSDDSNAAFTIKGGLTVTSP